VKIVVTGAGGMLGTALVRIAGAAGHETVALAHADLDVTDAGEVARRIAEEEPDAVVNCAAWTDVDGAEDNEAEATLVNGAGAGNVAEAAEGAGASVVYISTDYVFDGSKRAPYEESDEPAPLQAYGRSKLAGERATTAACLRSIVVRTSWLFGEGGPSFPETMLAIGARGETPAVVDDQVGCPTYTGHLAEALVALIERDEPGVHHVGAAGSCSWHEFAAEIFSQAGLDVRPARMSSEALGRPARRPASSVLGSERPDPIRLPDWREGLAEFLAERARSEGSRA
jgi:dTDP-4-dehydrorhamnose reductase